MTTKNESKYGTIEGVFVYAKIAEPDLKYQSTDKEWSIEVIVDEDTAEAWDEQFKKQSAKKIKVADFASKYRIPCPIEGVKNVYSIKLKRQATNDDVAVDENFRPKVFVDDAEGERTEIGLSRLIANGSVGKVSYYISSNDFGTFARLQNILMTEDGFKEYMSTTTGQAGDEFGESKPVKVEPPRKEATQARSTKAAPKAKQVVPSEDDSEAPF